MYYSYKRHCVVSLTVNDVPGPEEWHLPTYDQRNENMYLYKLHSLDIYFWTQQDALQFVNGIRRVLPPAQVEVVDEPAPPPLQSADVSAVVQKLERAALSETAAAGYHQPNGGAALLRAAAAVRRVGRLARQRAAAADFHPHGLQSGGPSSPGGYRAPREDAAARGRRLQPPAPEAGSRCLHALLPRPGAPGSQQPEPVEPRDSAARLPAAPGRSVLPRPASA